MRHGIRAARCASSAPSRFLLTTAQRVPSEGYHVVTGADAGLGLATTAALIEAGSTVVLGCANASRGQALAQKINAVTQRRSAIVCSDDDLDLGSTRSIAAFCDGLRRQLQQDGSRLASLVHHAGVMGLGKYTPTADGDETQWAMNYKGPFRLTHCLWDQILEDNTDVLCLTSASHCAPNLPLDFSMASSCESTYHGWRAYQQSKLAALLFSNELHRRLAACGSTATSRAVSESDKWFILPHLLLPDDKAELAGGPSTTLAALGGLGHGGCYLSDGAVRKPGEHASSEEDARRLWQLTIGES